MWSVRRFPPRRTTLLPAVLAALALAAPAAAAVFAVTNTDDAGAGSLRQAVLDANASSGADIIFFIAALDGQTITLTTGSLAVAAGSIAIDASSLPRGLTLSGGDAVRIFNVAANSALQLTRLRLVRGNAVPAGDGGAIWSEGSSLTLTDCTFTGNAGNYGGAIRTSRAASVNAEGCTFERNVAGDAGAIYLTGTGASAFVNCTFTANRATREGSSTGAVVVNGVSGAASFTHCTIVGNVGTSFGGGLYVGAPTTLDRCLIAGNTATEATSPDVYKVAAITTAGGANLIGNNGAGGPGTVAGVFPAGALAGAPGRPLDPRLGPLFRTGGPTATHSPRAGSPAINAAGVSPRATDQRGFPRGAGGASSDLGAVEAGPVFLVTNANDSGPGSLRAAVNSASAVPDGRVNFDPAFFGAMPVSIFLSSGPLTVGGVAHVQVDAGDLAARVTVAASGASRVFEVASGGSLSLNRVGISGGVSSSTGGGVSSSGDVSLFACDISGCQAASGAGLYAAAGTAELIGCRVAGNSSTADSAAHLGRGDAGTVTATDCWFGTSHPSAPAGFTPGVVFSPYVVFTLRATPAAFSAGSTCALTASVVTNSFGQAVAPDRLFPLVGRGVGFSGGNGTVSNAVSAIQAGGTATATFTGAAAGPAPVSAAFDGEIATATLEVIAPNAPAPARLINVSTRLSTGTGDNVLIAGVAVRNGPKKMVVRALGPSLAGSGVLHTLADPQLQLVDSATGTTVAANDDWQRGTQVAEIRALGRPPFESAESALVVTLAPGNYTAIVRGANNGTGNCLVEVYDAEPGNGGRLVNLSTRGLVGTGDNVMIAGFVVSGTPPKRILVLAKGPSLAAAGVPNVLADPTLSLNGGRADGSSGQLAANDNWQDTQAGDLAATGLAPTDPREAAILLTLPPGGYTAIVRGAGNSTGNAIVEVYELP